MDGNEREWRESADVHDTKPPPEKLKSREPRKKRPLYRCKRCSAWPNENPKAFCEPELIP